MGMRGTAWDRSSCQHAPAPQKVTTSGTRLVAARRGVQDGGGASCQQTTDFGWREVHEVGCVGLDSPRLLHRVKRFGGDLRAPV